MTPDRWIALLSAISGLGAAVFAAWNLYLIRRQRKTAIRPKMDIQSAIWLANERTLSEVRPMHGLVISPINLPSGSNTKTKTLNAFNYGTGPALDTKVSFTFRKFDIIRLIKSHRDERSFQYDNRSEMFDWIHTATFSGGINPKFAQNKDIGAVDTRQRLDVDLPLDYLILFTEFLRLLHSLRTSEKIVANLAGNLANYFTIRLLIQYRDLEGDLCKDTFDIIPSFLSFTLETLEFHGILEIKRK